jgi:hypothetical protein
MPTGFSHKCASETKALGDSEFTFSVIQFLFLLFCVALENVLEQWELEFRASNYRNL